MAQRRIEQGELDELVRKHKLWLEGKDGGEKLVLIDCDLTGSNLTGSNLSWSNLTGSDLSRSNLTGSNLTRSNLTRSNLRGSDLSRSNLSGSNLTGSNLSWSNLTGSNLRGSDLSRSNLSGSNLSGSNLSWSNLSGSNLSWSNLTGSNLDYSVLPLWCGSLKANFDDKQLIQIAYHLVKAGLNSDNASNETKTELEKLIDFANKFHRVDECGKIEPITKEKE